MEENTVVIEDVREDLLSKLKSMKPLSFKTGALVFGGVVVTGIMIGATIASYVFFGCISLAGIILISESNPRVKYFIINSNKTIDLMILAGTIYATATLGVTVAVGGTVTGLGYTVYALWLRDQYKAECKPFNLKSIFTR